ncbi:hypothetical protein NDU88_010963 [Pleurodeles waltl]|uniref:Uncharacterized protein n=1 Tax=Pleurodeles waltl TaxID=8319 RepID=A0AAV7PZE7_PLEWA|nr:hypothetical protein NDU88_010963 [Pleurodeles waltl]
MLNGEPRGLLGLPSADRVYSQLRNIRVYSLNGLQPRKCLPRQAAGDGPSRTLARAPRVQCGSTRTIDIRALLRGEAQCSSV